MYELTTNLPLNPPMIFAKDMKIGDIATIIDKSNKVGHIVLMSYDRLVSLTDPTQTWNRSSLIEVTIVPKGTSITLTV